MRTLPSEVRQSGVASFLGLGAEQEVKSYHDGRNVIQYRILRMIFKEGARLLGLLPLFMHAC